MSPQIVICWVFVALILVTSVKLCEIDEVSSSVPSWWLLLLTMGHQELTWQRISVFYVKAQRRSFSVISLNRPCGGGPSIR